MRTANATINIFTSSKVIVSIRPLTRRAYAAISASSKGASITGVLMFFAALIISLVIAKVLINAGHGKIV